MRRKIIEGNIMNKKTIGTSIGAILASVLLTTISAAGAQTAGNANSRTAIGDQVPIPVWTMDATPEKVNHSTNNQRLSEEILITIRSLREQGKNQGQIQEAIQSILNKYDQINHNVGQRSMSLGGFYGFSIFSCRGLA